MLMSMHNPQSIHVRLSPLHMARLRELGKVHGLRASELLRRLLDSEYDRVRREGRRQSGGDDVGPGLND